AVCFAWVVCPPPGEDAEGPFGSRFYLSGIYRLVAGSVVCAVFFLFLLRRGFDNPVFYEYLKNQAEFLSSLYLSATVDVVQRVLLENVTAELILDMIKQALLRGGGIVFCVFLFFVSRQVSYILVWLVRRVRVGSPLLSFHTGPHLIWITSASLLFILLSRITKWPVPEIILWNILVICVILYLAQGLGILQYFMARPALPPFFRFVLPPLFIVLVISPGINAVVLGLTILLGIAENWVPLRAPETGGPPSTPAV
ncbi:MAG: YybS family protein, partial [Treponema sp.]|nr:YybS family protein [Treponema sp.]